MSMRGDWETPPDMVADLATVFPWDLDVCASAPNICENYYDKATDGLKQDWKGLCFMNPPYGKNRGIGNWMEKARLEGAKQAKTIVCLVPARTSTQWWQDNVWAATQLVFIRGRLNYGSNEYWAWVWEQEFIRDKPNKLYHKYGRKQSAAFPSAFLVFGFLWNSGQTSALGRYGLGYHACIRLQ